MSNYTIEIKQDEYYEGPEFWGNEDVFLVYDHRQFSVERKGFDPSEINEHCAETKRLFYKGYFVLPLYAYIHSGVSLSLGRQWPFDCKWDELLQYVSKDELRPAMTALNFGYHKGKFNITATDGHTLAVVNVPGLDKAKSKVKEIETLFNLPAKTAKILYGYRPKKTDPFELLVWRANKDEDGNFKNVVFQFGDMTVITRNIDEKYPEYPQVMPTKHKTFYTGVKEDFLKQLDKAMICANKTTHQVRLSLNGKLSLSAEDLDFSNEFNGLVQGSYTGAPLEIGFNGKFLARVIEGAPKEFALYMNGPANAAVLKGENKTILVMPVMLNQYS